MIPVLMSEQPPPFAYSAQAIRGFPPTLWRTPAAAVPLLVQLLNAVLLHRQQRGHRDTHRPGHGIFVSHAKRDGLSTAERIVQTLTRASGGAKPALFLDQVSLVPGSDYQKAFEAAIDRGSLLAVVTDAYHTRPWCRWEVITAKRLGRPIIVADLGAGRIERTLPYLGNVPSQRVLPGAAADAEIPDDVIELLTFALLSEALRFDLWYEHALERRADRAWKLLARPPELADLVNFASMTAGTGLENWVVYPDPPLGPEEVDLLQRAFPHLLVLSLSQALSRL